MKETKRTHLFAFVGSNSSVRADVPFQVAALSEGLGAFHAAERLLNDAVFPDRRHLKMLQLNVSLQIRFLKIRFGASVAFERADAWEETQKR